MKSTIALILFLTASAGFAKEVEAKPSKDSKPNIIVIMPDDIGYGDIASLGNPV
ncbi:MAG: arylsulfatase, partial [Planctomycetaceae bacterium]|nr:arylsulfatase [Planctomycetaceae bacterium]